MLILLYCDLRLPKYGQTLEQFIDETSSKAALEILYYKIRSLIVTHTAITIPQSLISAFRAAFGKREKKWSSSNKKNTVKERFVTALEEAKKDHLIAYNRSDHLKILKNTE